MPTIEERRYGRDLVLPGRGQSVTPTLTGDWPTIAGTSNLRAASLRRIITAPRTMTHRPEYGAGLVTQIERPNTDVTAARTSASITDNFEREPRVASVETTTSSDTARDLVFIDVTIFPTGDDQSVTVSAEVAA